MEDKLWILVIRKPDQGAGIQELIDNLNIVDKQNFLSPDKQIHHSSKIRAVEYMYREDPPGMNLPSLQSITVRKESVHPQSLLMPTA